MKELILDSNGEYQSNRTHLSSSMLKLLLKSPTDFYAQWFGNVKQAPKDVFDEGSFVHSLVLEPDNISQYAIYPGLRKAGSAYAAFVTANPNKIILSTPQALRCEALAKSAFSSAKAMMLLVEGIPEHSLTSTILGVPVKMRADYIVPRSHIVDVKTTSQPTGVEFFKMAMNDYGYALSASLYCQIAFDNFNALHDFYFIVLSKADKGCAIYKASSETLSAGAAQVTQALVSYKKCMQSGDWNNAQSPSVLNNGEIEEV